MKSFRISFSMKIYRPRNIWLRRFSNYRLLYSRERVLQSCSSYIPTFRFDQRPAAPGARAAAPPPGSLRWPSGHPPGRSTARRTTSEDACSAATRPPSCSFAHHFCPILHNRFSYLIFFRRTRSKGKILIYPLLISFVQIRFWAQSRIGF